MTATTTIRGKTVDWQLWLPGIAAPIACFVFDFAAGEHLLLLAPAGLLCLAAIGIASLVISRNRRRVLAGLVTVGPMWIVGGLTLALAIPLTAIGGVGLLLSFAMLVRHPLLGLFVLIGALLGLSTFWTGVTYLVEAHALTKEQTAAQGRLKTGLFALVGGVAAISIMIAAQVIDSRWIQTQVAALDKQAPETWQAPLRALNAYPLCLRKRCRQLVCFHLSRQLYPALPPDSITWHNVPGSIDDAFKQAYGEPVREACTRYFD